VQRSIVVEDPDAARRQRGERVLGVLADHDGGHDPSCGHHQHGAGDELPRTQPGSSTAKRRRGRWRCLRFGFWLGSYLLPGWRRWIPDQGRIVSQHLLVKLLQWWAGIDA